MTRRRWSIAALVATLTFAAGCGAEGDYENEPRAPLSINVTTTISNGRVSVSPARFGAGPIVLVVANQTDEPQTVTIETDELDGDEVGLVRSTAPIEPRDTASLQVQVRQGRYLVRASGEQIEAARLAVGAPRPSGQNSLPLP